MHLVPNIPAGSLGAWIGARVRRLISKTLSDRAGKRLPSAEQMEALREKFAKPDKDTEAHAH
jgi:hypothetical protein